MDNHVRVRLAPSPTGSPHVGMMRTAIYNWLFARGRGGTFIVRIEDTDQGRLVEGSVDEMLESLRWLGIEWDEGPDIGGPNAPYHQSERLDDYHRAAGMLIERGAAYRCTCSPARLEAVRKDRGGYDRRCRSQQGTDDAGPSVVRFAMPLEGTTVLDDLIRGSVTFENGLVDDFVLLKSDGFPTYHLASVVDDRSMGISHVFRGEEWLSSVPRHLQLYEALGWEPPLFVHLPQILAPDRSKLSKRHGAVSVREYREMGYLPEAMVNFLALLGWSLDDKTEVMSTERAQDAKLLAGAGVEVGRDVRHQEARMDERPLHPPDGARRPGRRPAGLLARLPRRGDRPASRSRDLVARIVPLVHERLKTLRDAAPLVGFFFQDKRRVRGRRARAEEDGRGGHETGSIERPRRAGRARLLRRGVHRVGPQGAGRRARPQGRPTARLHPRRDDRAEGRAPAVRDPRNHRQTALPRRHRRGGRPAVALLRLETQDSDGEGTLPRLVLVDGNNVMGSRPDGWWRDRRRAMQRLVDEVAAHAAQCRRESGLSCSTATPGASSPHLTPR